MAIIIPDAFDNHIQSNHTNIYPYVVIDVDGLNIRISTNAFSIRSSDADNTIETYKPLLLNVPSLKESIDLETRKYKINSVSLDISNVEYEGTRFSELVAETSLMNSRVQIYWGSPVLNSNNDALLVYDGSVRRYSHTDDKVKIELEDRSQAYLHKDLPNNYLGTGEDIPDKYKNKPIPMVYGYVDRSPCVIEKNKIIYGSPNLLGEYNSELINYTSDGLFEGKQKHPIWISDKNLSYLSFIKRIEKVIDRENDGDNFYYKQQDQWAIGDGSSVTINSTLLFLNDFIQARGYQKPDTPSLFKYNDYQSADDSNNLLKESDEDLKVLTDNNNQTFLLADDHVSFLSNDVGSWTIEYESIGLNKVAYYSLIIPIKSVFENVLTTDLLVAINSKVLPPPNKGLGSEIVDELDNNTFISNFTQNSDNNELILSNLDTHNGYQDGDGDPVDYTDFILFDEAGVGSVEGGYGGESDLNNLGVDILFKDQTEQSSLAGISTFANNKTFEVIFFARNINADLSGGAATYQADLMAKIKELDISFLAEIEKPLTKDFFADVAGRLSSGVGVSPTAPSAILDILEKELGVDANSLDQAPNFSVDMNYAFTINKKINSKKLIEELASASPYIPHFDNQRNFKFDVIPATNPTADHTIQESKVIDFTFKRTKIENVKTKVEVKYKWDYARKEFGASVVALLGNGITLDDGTTGLDYSAVFNYYGLEQATDHSLSTLVVDDHRGKYIRDSATAKNLANFLLDYHMNQHLILSVKLPLSVGLVMEVGDIVELDSLLGGVKPYGLDYRSNAEASLNNQNLFPKFIITNTNKTLEMVTIECEQLHKLMQVDHLYDEEGIYDLDNADTSYQQQINGCTLQGSTNYDPDATYDDGSCTGFPVRKICLTGTTRDYQRENGEYIIQSANNTEDHQYHTTSSGEEYQTTVHDFSVCTFSDIVEGCTDPDYDNYNSSATHDDGSCQFLVGCNIWNANNVTGYNISSNTECEFGLDNFLLAYGGTNLDEDIVFNYTVIQKPIENSALVTGTDEFYFIYQLRDVMRQILPNIRMFHRAKYASGQWQYDSPLYSFSANLNNIVLDTSYAPNAYSAITLDDLNVVQQNNSTFNTALEGDICYVIALWNNESITDGVFRLLKYEDGSQSELDNLYPFPSEETSGVGEP